MIPGNCNCPACGSPDTEAMLTIGNVKTLECLTCNHIWTASAGNGELRHRDPHIQWGATGEEEF